MPIPPTLESVRDAIAASLHWPNNLGVELQPVHPAEPQGAEMLLLYIQGLADEELIRLRVLEPVSRFSCQDGRLTPARIRTALHSPRVRLEGDFDAMIEGVLKGAAALFVQGGADAVMVEIGSPATRTTGGVTSEQPHMDVFGTELIDNLALVRQRLSDPALIAEPHSLPRQRGTAAVLFLEGRADPEVVAQVRAWVERRGGEEAMRRGLAAGIRGKVGLLPERLSSKWPDHVATMLDTGYVVVMIDRVYHAYIAPVTATAMLTGAFDAVQIRPNSHLLRLVRFTLCVLVLIGSSSLVALMNYHHEMIPAPFLMALVSIRESAPLPILGSVLALEAFQEMMREAGFHLPGRFAAGAALIAGKILILILVQGGVIGALEGAVSVGVAFATLGLLNYELVYMLRPLRFAMILGAGAFGFFGMATILFLISMYLAQSKSYGVPFFGEPGIHYAAPGGISSRTQGGRTHGP